ncbi:MAG: integrin alpha, partial [Candidatus Thermoplasmatota archaeon]|nr:integrin alpha [Candidatus Thermoplasmatota archaeon]
FATGGEGCIYIFFGRSNIAAIEDDQVIPGTMRKSYFGLSIRLAGDVNNDGFADLIISTPEEDSVSHLKAGKVELFMGEEQGINTTPKLVMEGESNEALLGYTIAFLGDVNRDGFDDVAIGAPSHTSDGEVERGKFYIFLGDKSGFRDAPSVVELGDDAGDQLSMGLAGAGDIDGDGFKDVLVGAPGADTVGGIDSGELHIFRGSDLTMPPLQADAFEVMDLTEDELMLVELRAYQFRLSVTHRTGLGALDRVDLHMDPEGEDVILRFIAESHNLVEVKDEDDLVHGIFVRPTDSGTYLDTTDIILDIWLHWGFPSGRPLSIRVEATDTHGLRSTGRWSDAARVVDHLDFTDDITIHGDRQGLLTSGDWISSNEGLSFTDAMIVYDLASIGVESSIPYYPPNGKLKVVVQDDLGGEWSAPVLKGAPISVHAITPGQSRPEMTYTLSIESLDRSKVFRTVQFLLNVDGTSVSFGNPNPDPTSTIASKDHIISVEIEDPLGPGVDHTSVQYRLDIANDGMGFGEWKNAHSVVVLSDGSVIADVQEIVTEGDNFILWRAKDLVGNGFTLSMAYPIVVDLGYITFSNPLPITGKWHNTESAVVGITIENTKGNPLDLRHIQYRISTSPGKVTPWTTFDASASAGKDRSMDNIMTNLQFTEGDDNYIQWRARDMERYEYYASPLHKVLVDMSGPEFSEPSPSDAEWVNTRQVAITIVVDDVLSGTVDGSIGYHILGVDEEGIWHTPLSKTHRGNTIECTAYVNLKEGVENYILWSAEDAVGHKSVSFEQQIRVDTTAPTINEILPSPGAIILDRLVEVSVRVSDNGAMGEISGVDLRTLQYTIDRPESGQSSWVHPDIDTSNPFVAFETVNIFLEVEEGENWLIWRVKDAVGNEIKSEPFGILADLPETDTLEPVIIITEPIDHIVSVGDLVFFDAGQSYHKRGERLT